MGRRSIPALQHDSREPLRITLWILLLLLAVQFLLGMYANLSVAFPAPGSSASTMRGMYKNGMLVVMGHTVFLLHMVLGIHLVVLSGVGCALAVRIAGPVAMGLIGVGLVAVIGAGFAGMISVMNGQ